MTRFPFLALIAFASVSFGQQNVGDLFDKAPPDVDRALRTRISEFFQDHVTGEYRKAEHLVAEDTQDYFYDHGKPRYISFQIQHIKYNKDFTEAEALVMCEQAIMMPGFNGEVMKIPTPSAWKLIDGQWYWWVDPAKRNLTPFGQMKAGEYKSGGAGAPSVGSIPTSIDEVYEMVKADKTEISLKPGDSDSLMIGNAMPGPVTPEIVSKPQGVDVSFSDQEIKPNSRLTITLKAGDKAASGDLVIRIKPIAKMITVPVVVAK